MSTSSLVPLPSDSPVPSTTLQTSSIPSPVGPSPTPTGQPNGGSNSPLLFFVALGFGVVFTNLWIIVGVKYCFRYNQRRNRAANNADGDAVDLAAMPRPHRRRREKKLMTMEDVNTKFPLVKYKAWRASREIEGLPATGGISVPPSRAQSLKNAEGIIGRKSTESTRAGSALSSRQAPAIADIVEPPTNTPNVKQTPDTVVNATDGTKPVATANAAVKENEKPKNDTSAAPIPARRDSDETLSDDEDDDPIQNALVNDPDLLGSSGDTCAICLDVLEDDDDVRGLTCGHAFHGACVDPWLSTRRACCPLCKADYYVPKPRPEGEQRTRTNVNMPQRPMPSWLGDRTRSFIIGMSRNAPNTAGGNQTAPGQQNQSAPEVQQQNTPVVQRLVNIRWPFRNRNQQTNSTSTRVRTTPATTAGANSTVSAATPGQLEAGLRY